MDGKQPDRSDNGPIKHVVVLMFENRSYDNILGWLYDSSNSSPYKQAPAGQSDLNGLTTGGPYTNPNPYGGSAIPVANQITDTQNNNTGPCYPPTTIPIIDPGEKFADKAEQYLGTYPDSNPYPNPWKPSLATMQGFTANYEDHGGTLLPPVKPPQQPNNKDVMNYFTPTQVPFTSYLAHTYAVCEQWFASAPTQTFANRAFMFCAASTVAKLKVLGKSFQSLINNDQYINPLYEQIELPSVLAQLDAVNTSGSSTAPNWKIYFHDYSISRLVVPYVDKTASRTSNQNVAPFDDKDWPGSNIPSWLGAKPSTFFEDVQNGLLAPFTLIEPRYSNSYAGATPGLSPNSNHPGSSNYPTLFPKNNVPIDVADGEALLQEVYETFSASKCWKHTLFIVRYDEPGGIYDHVPPPAATPPGTINWPGVSPPHESPTTIPAVGKEIPSPHAEGFNFYLFGGRVPALIVSPSLKTMGSTITSSTPTAFDHTSIIKTVWEIFNLSQGSAGMPSLNSRDANAPSLSPFLSS